MHQKTMASIFHLSCFDLDHTLLSVNSSFAFGSFLYKKGVFSSSAMLYLFSCYTLYKVKIFSMDSMQEKIFSKLFYGRFAAEITSLAEEFVRTEFYKLLNIPAVNCLKEAQNQNHFTVILSSSPNFLVEPFAKYFNVNISFGTRYGCKDNCFQSIELIMKGKDKAMHMQLLAQDLNLKKQQTTAYSDSYIDIDFLQAAGKAVAVNPDRRLRAACREYNWQIIE